MGIRSSPRHGWVDLSELSKAEKKEFWRSRHQQSRRKPPAIMPGFRLDKPDPQPQISTSRRERLASLGYSPN